MAFMQDIAPLTRPSLKPYQRLNIKSCWISIRRALFSFCLSGMTLFNAQNVCTKWSFLNSTIITNQFLSLNSMKGQWQNIVAAPVANLLDSPSHLFHTVSIKDGRHLQWS